MQRTNGLGTAKTCNDIVQEEQAGDLGEGPVCSWDASGQTLQVMLGQGATIGVGSGLFVLPNVVKSFNGVSSWNSRRSGGGVRLIVTPGSVVLLPRSVLLLSCSFGHNQCALIARFGFDLNPL